MYRQLQHSFVMDTSQNMDSNMFQSAYVAKEDLLDRLLEELNDPKAEVLGQLVLSSKPFKELYFKQNGWKNVETISISSIQDGARKLKALGKYWAFYPSKLNRRGLFIQEELAKLPSAPLIFPAALPQRSMGAWTLLDQNTMLVAKETTSPFPHGIVEFQETKIPPSRAYLKLYEALMHAGKTPQKGNKCLEIGAAPGSWSYVLASLDTELKSCDRSSLDESLNRFPNLTFVKGDAFKLTPEVIGPIDWLFSDLICYPDKLYEYISLWLESGMCKNFICTLKFQEGVSISSIEKFAQIKDSKVLHLFHNKHELTWIKVDA